jgi:hypothetical protein
VIVPPFGRHHEAALPLQRAADDQFFGAEPGLVETTRRHADRAVPWHSPPTAARCVDASSPITTSSAARPFEGPL